MDLCYVISHGFSARMVLHSDLVPELAKRGLSMAVVTPNAGEPSMQALADELGIEVHPIPVRAHVLASVALERIQRYVFEDVAENNALLAKHQRDIHSPEVRTWQRGLAHLMMGVNRATRRAPVLPRALQRVRELLLHNAAVTEHLRQIKPHMVVATYPINPIEATYLHEAQRLGIDTVSHLLSWDNITCKGSFAVVPRYHISWGPIMSEELQAHYGVAPDHVFECGVPHFDAHVRSRNQEARARALRDLGLEPARPYLFFGMSSPVFAPREIDVVEWLADRVRRGDFGDDMQLIVRPHPQNVQGSMSDPSWLGRLEAIVGESVAVDIPRLEESKLIWNMRRDDLPRLVELIAGCAICLNSGSTLSIDAIVQDRPVVLTAFDAHDELPWWGSARRLPDYPHLTKLIAMEGLRVTRSFAELKQAIAQYLADPSLDAAGRARTRERECGRCDGHAAQRVAEALTELRGRGVRSAAA